MSNDKARERFVQAIAEIPPGHFPLMVKANWIAESRDDMNETQWNNATASLRMHAAALAKASVRQT